jgi:hypothetical protein
VLEVAVVSPSSTAIGSAMRAGPSSGIIIAGASSSVALNAASSSVVLIGANSRRREGWAWTITVAVKVDVMRRNDAESFMMMVFNYDSFIMKPHRSEQT